MNRQEYYERVIQDIQSCFTGREAKQITSQVRTDMAHWNMHKPNRISMWEEPRNEISNRHPALALGIILAAAEEAIEVHLTEESGE